MVIRIGELSRRVGVSEQVLRAWESRYDLLEPRRTPAGYRLYSGRDELRVRTMIAHLDTGMSAAQAAVATLAGAPLQTSQGSVRVAGPDTAGPTTAGPTTAAPPTTGPTTAVPDNAVPDNALAAAILSGLVVELRVALDTYDEARAHAVIDEMIESLSLTTVLRHGILPYLAELGDRWANGTASIAQEHFASNLLRGRLAGLARGWGLGSGQRAVLACPPGELHDLTLMVFGIVLARHGWRITYLGMDTPVSDLHSTARAVEADLVVLAATGSSSLDGITAELAELAASVPLLLGGAGATRRIADQVGATLLMGDPISVAEQLGTTTRIGATR